MNSKLTNNTPSIFLKYQERINKSSDIENGNDVDGKKQSKIITSDIRPADGYGVNYNTLITNIVFLNAATGNLNSFGIEIAYTADLEAGATNPGFFGSNLIRENDAFTISSTNNDWVRGFVNRIADLTVTGGPVTYTYTYYLICTITQGDPLKMSIADTFYWSRQLNSASTDINAITKNISASYNPRTYETYIDWIDNIEGVKKHLIQFRKTDNTFFPTSFNIFKSWGNKLNFNGALTPIIDAATGDVSTIKIVDPGSDFSYIRRIELLGNGRGAKFVAIPFTNTGALSIHEYEVIGVTVGGSTILLKAKQTYPVWNWPQPLESAYIEGLPGILYDNYVVSSVTALADNLFAVDISYAENSAAIVSIPTLWSSSIVNSTLKIHNGIFRISVTNLNIATESNSQFVYLTNSFLPDWFVGCNITSTSFPGGTYITEITDKYIKFNNAAIITGSGNFTISGNGVDYTSKTRCSVKSFVTNNKFVTEPVWDVYQTGDYLGIPEYAISISAILDDSEKKYTQWSEEVYMKTK